MTVIGVPPPPRQRAETVSMKRFSRRQLRIWSEALPPSDDLPPRPTVRGECAEGPRPCPYVSCRYHLYLDVSARTGSIQVHFPDQELEDLKETCALDVADRGGSTLNEVGRLINLTRERVRQIEHVAVRKIRHRRLPIG